MWVIYEEDFKTTILAIKLTKEEAIEDITGRIIERYAMDSYYQEFFINSMIITEDKIISRCSFKAQFIKN